MIKIIAIKENNDLIAEANKIFFRTDQSDDVSDNLEIGLLIDRILKYVQDEEIPELMGITAGYEKITALFKYISTVLKRTK